MNNEFIWVFSNEILTEYAEKIIEKFSFKTGEFVLNSLLNSTNHLKYEPEYKWQLIEKDADDNKFVDCAIGANVDYLVSDDWHIRELSKIPNLFPPVPIISFREFKDVLENQ